ncbi:MAG: glycosyltransferase family 4 protein [Desulfobulbus sp.]|jgi:glycosyltransferase involved in cell wall biosynthesis|nr:glycosyltransferase family 4 protein [Desulfobulbus sp.]
MNLNSSQKSYSLDDIRKNWKLLDDEAFPDIDDVRLISHEHYVSFTDVRVEFIPAWRFSKNFLNLSFFYWFLYALRLLFAATQETVIIVNGGITWLWVWCGILNIFPFIGRKTLLCWDIFVEFRHGAGRIFKISAKRKEKIARFVLDKYKINVLWSAKQVKLHADHFHLPEDRFIYIPYKANHSIRETFEIPMNNFVFAGGNGKRDYQCLIDAVEDTGIPVIISATDPKVRAQIKTLPNVMIIGAPEPAFGQLQAASRFVVIPMIYTGLKGGGEANFCNAMWHKKPIIAVDSMSAEEYIIEGKTGYVIKSGDSSALREKILLLWNNPALCEEMGIQGRKHVEEYFTHRKFLRRLLRLALLCGKNKSA